MSKIMIGNLPILVQIKDDEEYWMYTCGKGVTCKTREKDITGTIKHIGTFFGEDAIEIETESGNEIVNVNNIDDIYLNPLFGIDSIPDDEIERRTFYRTLNAMGYEGKTVDDVYDKMIGLKNSLKLTNGEALAIAIDCVANNGDIKASLRKVCGVDLDTVEDTNKIISEDSAALHSVLLAIRILLDAITK